MPDSALLVAEYRAYLERFDEKLGSIEFGAYAKHQGRLIKKLRYDEFEPKLKELLEMQHAYGETIARGDTINDLVVRILRERCDELILERSI